MHKAVCRSHRCRGFDGRIVYIQACRAKKHRRLLHVLSALQQHDAGRRSSLPPPVHSPPPCAPVANLSPHPFTYCSSTFREGRHHRAGSRLFYPFFTIAATFLCHHPMNRRETRSTARNTLFIDTDDAAFWLAASSFVEDEPDGKRRSKGHAEGLRLNVPLPYDAGQSSPLSSTAARFALGNSSRRRPKKTAAAPPPASPLPSVPTPTVLPLNIARKDKSPRLPATVASTPPALFSSPRPAPPTPDVAALEQTNGSSCPSPLSPLPLPARKQNGGTLLSPVRLRFDSLEPPSPCLSSHPGSSLLHATPRFQDSHDSGLSAGTVSSVGSHQTGTTAAPEPTRVGAAIIASFPTPPQREHRAHIIDYNEAKRLALVEGKGRLAGAADVMDTADRVQKTTRPISKPLPPPPIEHDDDCRPVLSEEEFRKPGELHAWSVGFDTAGCPRVLPTPSAFHRPSCPYAARPDVLTEQCGCRSELSPYMPGVSNMMSSSAPNLLDLVQEKEKEATAHETEHTKQDLRLVKKVMYRLSDEMRELELAQEQDRLRSEPRTPPARPGVIDKPTDSPQQTQPPRVHFAPANKIDKQQIHRPSTPDPSRPIQDQLWPAPTVLENRALTPGPSLGLAAGMLHACLSPRSGSTSFDAERPREYTRPPPAVRPQRSFDALRQARPDSPALPLRAPVTPPARRLISTVRAHDRNNGRSGSPARKASSPPLVVNPDEWDLPWHQVRSYATIRHQRQASSKSSSSSGGSTFGSSGASSSTHATTTESLPSTPIWAKLQHKGQPSMGSIPEFKAKGKNDNHAPSPRRHKQDTAYFASAVDPFPLEHADRKPSQRRRQANATQAHSTSQHHTTSTQRPAADSDVSPTPIPMPSSTVPRVRFGIASKSAGPAAKENHAMGFAL